MKYQLISMVASCLALAACAGDKPAAESPDDAAGEGEGEGEGADDGKTGDGKTGDGKDGIVRDADGDGVPDEEAAKCEGMPETRCKITAGCAWNDSGACVDAKASPM